MPVNLEGLEVEACEGRWRIEYIGLPHEHADRDHVDYYLRCKWIDPHEPNNRATPERRLQLKTYASQEAYGDFEGRMAAAIQRWLDGPEETAATVDRESP